MVECIVSVYMMEEKLLKFSHIFSEDLIIYLLCEGFYL
jgi:hypothetical protein